jgi:hypothetical protein
MEAAISHIATIQSAFIVVIAWSDRVVTASQGIATVLCALVIVITGHVLMEAATLWRAAIVGTGIVVITVGLEELAANIAAAGGHKA